jgi:hypothetical protein
MGDSMPRQDPPEYNPNSCDHPYHSVEEQPFTLTSENGTTMETYTFKVCTDCGYIVDQPEKFNFKCVGGWNKKYNK